jgi:hypothetical protein
MPTLSEQLFERFCVEHRLLYERVATASERHERRPDYRIVGHEGGRIFAEVKQFDPTAEETDAIAQERRGEIVVRGGVPGARLRDAIANANAQLRAMSMEERPGLLVVYNNVWGARYHTEAYAVLTAMRGLDIVPVVVPPDLSHSPMFLPMRPGPKKTLTTTANTHVSAVAVLNARDGEELVLNVFHSKHARVPLRPAELAGPAFTHLRMRADESDWEVLGAAV